MSAIRKIPFSSILGWSSTRYDCFSICKRRYFYQYYSKYAANPSSVPISRYKDLASVPLAIGSIVHSIIETLLHRLQTNATTIESDKFFDYAVRSTEHALRTVPFDEVVYGVADRVSLEDVYPKIQRSLENFLASDRFAWITRVATGNANDWIIDPPGYGETRLGDLKLYCKVDFLLPVNGVFHILDWKTGKPDAIKHRNQLVGYASWASYHFDIDPSTVRPTIAYLHPDYKEMEEAFNTFDLESFAIQVRAETDEMYSHCRDVDGNIPVDQASFPMIDNSVICGMCAFRGLCYPASYQANFATRNNPEVGSS